jgi:hypothetical protein
LSARGDEPPEEPSPPAEPPPPAEITDDQSAILDATLGLSRTQLLAQIGDEASLDGRTMGLLAFNGALLAADVAARELLGKWWWWSPLPFIAVAAGLCLYSTFAESADLGPQALGFYVIYGGLTTGKARLQLLADLDTAFAKNATRVKRKNAALRWALVIVASGLVIAAFLIVAGKPSTMKSYATCPTATSASAASADRRPAGKRALPAAGGANAGSGSLPGAPCAPGWPSSAIADHLR